MGMAIVLPADETTPIIRTKLHRPPIPEDHVHRPRLLEQLEKSRRKQLTLVSAPAGYGKSILLSCWLENCDVSNAWYSVDESDNNLRQFLIYFLTAIRTMFPDAVEKTLALANAGNLPPMKALLANLINEMNLVDQDYILVIDDIHLIQEKQVYDLLTELLRHSPQRMHLVLIGRRDPFLPISSFRAQGLLTEIRLQDLCFTTAETTAYLEQVLGEQIEDAVAEEWTEKTDAWIAGLLLAALSMRHRGDAASMLPEMPGGSIRPFVELGSPMAELLKRLLRQNVAVDYIGKILAAFGEDETGSPSLQVPKSPHLQVIPLPSPWSSP